MLCFHYRINRQRHRKAALHNGVFGDHCLVGQNRKSVIGVRLFQEEALTMEYRQKQAGWCIYPLIFLPVDCIAVPSIETKEIHACGNFLVIIIT